jgi:hypothetical protein
MRLPQLGWKQHGACEFAIHNPRRGDASARTYNCRGALALDLSDNQPGGSGASIAEGPGDAPVPIQ